jgi:hypothetical protein
MLEIPYNLSPVQQTLPGMSEHGTAGCPLLMAERRAPASVARVVQHPEAAAKGATCMQPFLPGVLV